MRMLCLLACVVTAFARVAVAAEAPTATEIIKNVKQILEPSKSGIRKLVFTVDTEGEKVQIVAHQANKQFPDGKKVVTVTLQPDDVRGTAFLVFEPKEVGKPTITWVYVPFLDRVKKLIEVEANESFVNTDFTYSDLGFVRFHENYKLLGVEEKDGKNTYKVEETVPQESYYYSKIITWVTAAGMNPVQRDYYDPAAALWKRETFGPVRVIDGIPTILRRVMKNVQEGTSTDLEVQATRYDVELSDDLFDPKEMRKVAEHPAWKAFAHDE
jgi:hypothetical protein